jgi:hypothetical protein
MLEKLRYVTRRVDRSGRERLYWHRRGHPLSPLRADELTAAEERMWELGFAVEADGNVIAWKYRQEPFVVLADPLVRRRLRFCVYDEERLAAASVAAAVSRLLPPSERVRLPQSSTCSTIGDRTSSANFSRVCRRRLQRSVSHELTNDHWHGDAMARKHSLLPPGVVPLGLSREQAAEYIGVSATIFDEMVDNGQMPQPKVRQRNHLRRDGR